ncbi:Metallophos domain-containing protein [Cucumis melo var. makuwa]|uniref:Metallophos domain-containing protein n=2 Tax=Cucumis melo TaxID=3656 RepID=A0A5D3BFP4_CUCMM|nr:uncharacterized protein LOC103496658 [Cucumis melo]TYJ97869.1 Metallophos domain-containing protein [Cucumis melo var. makuwa]
MLGALGHAPFIYFLSAFPPPSIVPNPNFLRFSLMAISARIAVIGDVHGYWDLREDSKALQLLQPDLVLFTGDFGEENVELVRSIADLKFAKAAILGNHDAWFTPCFSQEKKDGVQLQLECLGENHIGYRRMDFPQQKLSIVGGRPFSHGGKAMFRKQLLSARYGVKDMKASAKRIYETAIGAPEDHLVIILAHNGPTGLGSRADDICGKDWEYGGGDWGDEDLEQAISKLKENGKFHVPPLVVFGHMHKELTYGGQRKMIVVTADNTIYLNGAIVPRVTSYSGEEGKVGGNFTSSETSCTQSVSRGTKRAFTVVDISDGKVDKVTESWISVVGDETSSDEANLMYQSGISKC